MGIFLIILILLFVMWPVIVRWLRPIIMRYMARKMEDQIRRAAGMPPRDDRRSSRKKQQERQQHSTRRRSSSSYYRGQRQHIIPPEYAEDVEFTEIKDYSKSEEIAPENRKTASYRQESQVSDAVWEEIKPRKKK